MMSRGFGLFSMLMFTCLLAGCTSNEEINQLCTNKYKDNVFGRWNCIQNETREAEQREKAAKEVLAEQAREAAARPCIARDLPRMEDLAARAINSVEGASSLEEVRPKIINLLGSAELQEAKDNIKEKVLISRVDTKCNSQFYLLVNVRAHEDGTIRYAKVWSKNAPQGYDLDQVRFTNDLDKKQADEWLRLAAEAERKRNEEARKKQAETFAALQGDSAKPLTAESDPCAPNITKTERLRRLAQFGIVRETGMGQYQAGTHSVMLASYNDSVISCR